jgi:hypothetical protein
MRLILRRLIFRFFSLDIIGDKISSSGSTSGIGTCDFVLSAAGPCELSGITNGVGNGAAAVTVDDDGTDRTSTEPNLFAGRASDSLHIFGGLGAAVATPPSSDNIQAAVPTTRFLFFTLRPFYRRAKNMTERAPAATPRAADFAPPRAALPTLPRA